MAKNQPGTHLGGEKENQITDYKQILFDKKITDTLDYFVITIDGLFTEDECQEMIKLTEETGYKPALVNIGFGKQKFMPDVRKCERCIIDSHEMAGKFWEKIKIYVPAVFNGYQVAGLNERMRFLKYEKSCYFKPHFDGSYIRPDESEISFVTFFLFLNEGFKGGESTFISQNEKNDCKIVPKTGRLILFQHHIYHEGSLLKEGVKYALRTDIMYTTLKKK